MVRPVWFLYAALIWLSFVFVAFTFNVIYTSSALRRHPWTWLARRGVVPGEDRDPKVIWVRGKMRHTRDIDQTWIVVVVCADFVFVECPAPVRLKRERALVRAGRLRFEGGHVSDGARRFRVGTKPPERLVAVLASKGWTVEGRVS